MSIRKEVIGDATLYCGDCLDIMPLLLANSVKLLWTDPPYGHSNMAGDLLAGLNECRGNKSTPIENDDAVSMRAVVDGMLNNAERILDAVSCCCCCCAGGGGPNVTFAWLANRLDSRALQFFHAVIWDKNNPGLGWRFRRQYEFVMVAHKRGAKLAWNDREAPMSNIISISAPRENRHHPNEKPLGLISVFIKKHTTAGDMVFDPFMGSGSTGVAALKMGRKFVGIELDEHWFDVACRRIEDAWRESSLMRVAAPQTHPEQLSLTAGEAQ